MVVTEKQHSTYRLSAPLYASTCTASPGWSLGAELAPATLDRNPEPAHTT